MRRQSVVKDFVQHLHQHEFARGVEPRKQTLYLTQDTNTTALLIIHGFTSSPIETSYIANLCHHEAHVDVLAICLPGHGSRPEHMIDCTATQWIEAGKKAYEALAAGYDQVIVSGISMGSLVALQCAVEYNPEGIVCVAPALLFSDWRLRLAGPITPLLSKWASMMGIKTIKSKETETNKDTIYPYFPIESMAPLYQMASRTQKSVSTLTAPLLIGHSVDDTVCQPKSAQLLFKKAGSRCKQLIWSSGEHNFVACPNPDQQVFTKQMVEFCKEPTLYFANLA